MSDRINLEFLYIRKMFIRGLQGMAIALALLAILLVIIGEVESWIYLPVITVSIGGIGGGIFYYLLIEVCFKNMKNIILIQVLYSLVFLVIFWLSLVLALDQLGLWD